MKMTCVYGCERTRKRREARRVAEERCHRKIERGIQCFVQVMASARESDEEAGDNRPCWVDTVPQPFGAVFIGRKQREERVVRGTGVLEKPEINSEPGTGLATRATACACGVN